MAHAKRLQTRNVDNDARFGPHDWKTTDNSLAGSSGPQSARNTVNQVGKSEFLSREALATLSRKSDSAKRMHLLTPAMTKWQKKSHSLPPGEYGIDADLEGREVHAKFGKNNELHYPVPARLWNVHSPYLKFKRIPVMTFQRIMGRSSTTRCDVLNPRQGLEDVMTKTF